VGGQTTPSRTADRGVATADSRGDRTRCRARAGRSGRTVIVRAATSASRPRLARSRSSVDADAHAWVNTSPGREPDRYESSRQSGEQLRQPTTEVHRRVEQSVGESVDDVPPAVPGCSGQADRRVVRPHRAVVVAERIVGAHRCRQRSDTPTGPELVAHQAVEIPVGEVRLGDARPQSVARIRRERVDPAARSVDCLCEPSSVVPETLVEQVAHRVRLVIAAVGIVVAAHAPVDVRSPRQRRVGVPLHLDQRDRPVGQ
jgi:hypothetical protein